MTSHVIDGSALGEAFTTCVLIQSHIVDGSALGEAFSTGELIQSHIIDGSALGEAFANAVVEHTHNFAPGPTVGEAFAGDLAVQLFKNVVNPEVSGQLVDIGDSSVFQLTIAGTLVDLAVDNVNMQDLTVSYDGRDLSFEEITLISSNSFQNEDLVTLEVDFTGTGSSLETLFTGRIRQVVFSGRNNNELVSYQALGTQQLANEVTLLNTTARPDVSFVVGTTILTVVDTITTVRTLFTVRVRDAIETLFELSSTALDSISIPSTIGVPGLEQFSETKLPETMVFQNVGFVQAVSQLVELQPGVKVMFEESNQVWVFPDIFDLPIARINISSVNVNELPFTYDTDDRFTAVRLLADLEDTLDEAIISKSNTVVIGGVQGFLSRTEIDLTPKWREELETNWSLLRALNPGVIVTTPATIITLQGFEDPNFWVFKRWAMPETIIRQFPGTPVQAFGLLSRFGEFRWQKIHGRANFKRREFIARFSQIDRGNPFVEGEAFGPSQMKLAYFPLQFNFSFPTSTTTEGSPTAFVNTLIDGSESLSEIRAPAVGFSGTAFDQFGIERELVQIVQRTQVTSANAFQLLNLYNNVVISGDLPIDGDPLPIFTQLQRQVVVQDANRITQIESLPAIMTQWSYQFGKRGLNTVSLTTDVAGLIRVQL